MNSVAVAPDKFTRGIQSRGVGGTYLSKDGTALSAEQLTRLEVVELREALEREYPTDAHVVCYVVHGSDRQPRIKKSALACYEGAVAISTFMADCDNPNHGDWTDALRAAAREQEASAPSLQTCGVYESEHGRRFVQPLELPIAAGPEAERYLERWLKQLASEGVPVDMTCKDWTRNFRLPKVRRNGRDCRLYMDLSRMRPIALAPLPPEEPKPAPVRQASRPRGDALLERARKYVDAVPPAIEGHRGDEHTFKLCANLTRGFDLSDDEAFDLLREWNAACQPPWEECELEAKIANGRAHGQMAIGCLKDVPAPERAPEITAAELSDFLGTSRTPGEDDGDPTPCATATEEPEELAEDWQPVPMEWLENEPPERKYLLTWHDQSRGLDVGALPLGIAAMLAGAGGSGKSFIAIQLAVAVAIGGKWFGFGVAQAGRVLIVLGEEDKGETRRRIYYACRSLGLSREERLLVSQRVVTMAMAGKNVALTRELKPGESGLPITEWSQKLAKRVAKHNDWALIVLDPLSRFAGPDVEVDNSAATRFVQTIEQFANLPSRPTVLVLHHTGKLSRREGHSEATPAAAAAAARGSSGLTDGVRWVATLEVQKKVDGAPEISVLRIPKSNYGITPPDTHLVSNPDNHGVREVADKSSIAKYAAAADEHKAARSEDRKDREHSNLIVRVVKIVNDAPGPLSVDTIRGRAKRSKAAVQAAIADAFDQGLIDRHFVGAKLAGWKRLDRESDTSDADSDCSGLIRTASDSGPDLDSDRTAPFKGSPSPDLRATQTGDSDRKRQKANGKVNGGNGHPSSGPSLSPEERARLLALDPLADDEALRLAEVAALIEAQVKDKSKGES